MSKPINGQIKEVKMGLLNVYKYTENKDLKIKKFETMSDEWLDFITDCRSGKVHSYDIVEANG